MNKNANKSEHGSQIFCSEGFFLLICMFVGTTNGSTGFDLWWF